MGRPDRSLQTWAWRQARKLEVPAERIRQLHLPRRLAIRLEQPRARDQDHRAPRPRCGDVQAIQAVGSPSRSKKISPGDGAGSRRSPCAGVSGSVSCRKRFCSRPLRCTRACAWAFSSHSIDARFGVAAKGAGAAPKAASVVRFHASNSDGRRQAAAAGSHPSRSSWPTASP